MLGMELVVAADDSRIDLPKLLDSLRASGLDAKVKK
jgi:hypothetical protein